MALIKLIGTHHNYIFDSDNKASTLLTSGKFSSVYKGFTEFGKTPVVIKKFNPVQKFAAQALRRFKQEATISINDSNIAKTLDYISQYGDYYLVREFVEGADMLSFLNHKKLNEQQRLKFIILCGIEVLNALEVIHLHKIIHCDIRPHNIVVEYKDINAVDILHPKIKLIDFGLAKHLDHLSKTSNPFSLIYSPPEQLLTIYDAINETSDCYSLAITLYELITRKRPFYADNPELLMHLQLTQHLTPHPLIPERIFLLLLKATAKHKFALPPNRYKKKELLKLLKLAQKQRFQTAKEFKDELVKALNPFF